MYKLLPNDLITNQPSKCVLFVEHNLYIPFDPDNTDYAEFKKAVTAGAELQDADGNTMSSEAAQTFVRGLP